MRIPAPLVLLAPLAALVLAVPAAAQNVGIKLATGVDAYFEVPYDPLVVPPTGLTVEAWIIYDDSTIPTGTYYWPTIVRQNTAPQMESYNMRVGAANTNNRSLEFAVRAKNGGLRLINYLFTPGQFKTNWTHVAGTFDGSTMNIYVNGLLVQSAGTTAVEIPDAGGVLRVGDGDLSNPGHETWNGEIDELRIWPFARTQAEIQATMNSQLVLMPGRVLTFNLNSIYLDTSSGLMGTPVGPIAFATNSNPLAPLIGGGSSVGQSSSTCRSLEAAYGSPAVIGNAAFELVGTKGPANGTGAAFLSTTTFATPLTFFGVQLHLQNILLGISVTTDGLGTARLPVPVPNKANLIGAQLCSQFFYVDGTCGAQGVTASDAVCFKIQ